MQRTPYCIATLGLLNGVWLGCWSRNRPALARIHRWTRIDGVRTLEGGVRKLQKRWSGLDSGRWEVGGGLQALLGAPMARRRAERVIRPTRAKTRRPAAWGSWWSRSVRPDQSAPSSGPNCALFGEMYFGSEADVSKARVKI